MKKLIAILAVFAVVAGAAFAQEGSWSVGASGNIGTKIDLIPFETPGGHMTTELNGYDYRGAGDMRGNLSVNYNKGGLSAGLSFEQGNAIGTSLSFSGENFEFSADGSYDFDGGSSIKIGRGGLWGNYKFDVLNGLKLEVSVQRQGQQWWNITDIFGDSFTATKYGGGPDNYLLVDAGIMEGLNAGFLLPHVFPYATSDLTIPFMNMVFGAKFSTGPVAVALQYALLGNATSRKEYKEGDMRSGIYLSAQFQINDQMSAAAEFKSIFGNEGQDKDGNWINNPSLNIGGKFDFNSGDFSAGITVKFEDPTATGEHDQSFSINPSVSYVLVPDYLKFALGAGFTFTEKHDPNSTDPDSLENVISYSFQPELFFNFLGTGAGNFDTGIVIRYKVAGPAADGYFEPTKGRNTDNYFEIMFGWKF